MDKQEKKLSRKLKKIIEDIRIKGVRLYDPRVKRLRRAGNNNPALILYDIVRRGGYPVNDPGFETWIKKMANVCDKMEAGLSGMVEKRRR